MTIPTPNSNKKAQNIQKSFGAWFKGFGYTLQNPWVYKYIAAAIFTNLLVFVVLIVSAWFLSQTISNNILNNFTQNQLIYFVFSFVLWGLFAFVISQLFSGITTVINAPIYSILTNKILEKEFAQTEPSNSSILSEIFTALIFELKKLVLSFGFLLVLFLVNFIPVIGTLIYFIVVFLQIIFITGLDVFEPYHSIKKLTFRKRLKAINQKKSLYWPFLFVCGILGLIPFLNIFENSCTG